jgi:hypothetical protein
MILAPATDSNWAFRESIQELEPEGEIVYRTIQPIRNRNLRRMKEARRIDLNYLQPHIFSQILHLLDAHNIECPLRVLPQVSCMQQLDPGRPEAVMIVEYEIAVFVQQFDKDLDR